MPFEKTSVVRRLEPVEVSAVEKQRQDVRLRLKRQGYYTTHRWLRNQGFPLSVAINLLGYPRRFS